MSPFLAFLPVVLLLLAGPAASAAEEVAPISITSPDAGTTFAYGTIKSRSLFWDKHAQMLIARVTFTDSQQNFGSPNDDTHEFRLPGVRLDEAKGIFSAITVKGVVIPVARFRKTLFVKTIEILPNARVRVLHDRGNLGVVLEAISPNDPAMHPATSNPDGEHKVDIDSILQ